MYIIDTNALVLLLIGIIDESLISTHKRTSIYDVDDFIELSNFIDKIENLIVLPNVWTEVDNLLNDFNGNYKYSYLVEITKAIKSSSEQYLSSLEAIDHDFFFDLGITDCLLLTIAKQNKYLITSDSKLSDYATSLGIQVYDLVKIKNLKLLNY